MLTREVPSCPMAPGEDWCGAGEALTPHTRGQCAGWEEPGGGAEKEEALSVRKAVGREETAGAIGGEVGGAGGIAQGWGGCQVRQKSGWGRRVRMGWGRDAGGRNRDEGGEMRVLGDSVSQTEGISGESGGEEGQ